MNRKIEHTDHTETKGFESASRNVLTVEPWECPHCLQRFGVKGRNSAQVRVITAKGTDVWCMKCYTEGLEKGICIKDEKLSKKKLKKKAPACKNCGKKMLPVLDSILKIYTGYLWRCTCMSKNVIVSIG